MIDQIMYAIKLSAFVVAAITTARLVISNGGGNAQVPLWTGGVALFMTGVEMITLMDAPWRFLFLDANYSDWTSAVIGGVGLLFSPIVIYAVIYAFVGQDIKKLLTQTNS